MGVGVVAIPCRFPRVPHLLPLSQPRNNHLLKSMSFFFLGMESVLELVAKNRLPTSVMERKVGGVSGKMLVLARANKKGGLTRDEEPDE